MTFALALLRNFVSTTARTIKALDATVTDRATTNLLSLVSFILRVVFSVCMATVTGYSDVVTTGVYVSTEEIVDEIPGELSTNSIKYMLCTMMDIDYDADCGTVEARKRLLNTILNYESCH